MAENFQRIAFTPEVLAAQRQAYGVSHAVDPDSPETVDPLGEPERAFIEARDSFYLATVSATGWPYVQHRGGAPGFLRVLDPHTVAFADLGGNRQLVTTGHLAANDRVALILMDYPNRRRLKILGRARVVAPSDRPKLAALVPRAADAERLIVVHVHGLDWNCPKSITPRYTEAEVEAYVAPLRERLRELEGRSRRDEDPGDSPRS